MRRSLRWMAVVCVMVGAVGAQAKNLAALQDQPPTGGELRLASPKTLTVEGASPNSAPVEVAAFPLKHTAVQVEVQGTMASVSVEQTFENPFDELLEAIYVFPLGAGAAVNDYEIIVGERTIKGKIDVREKARATYNQARSEGRTAGLLEQHKANVFQQSVANIPPKQKVIVRFHYVELLSHIDGEFQFVYPMVVGPRYLPAQTDDPRPVGSHRADGVAPTGPAVSIPYVGPTSRPATDVELRVVLDAAVAIAKVESPTHQIVQKKVDDTTREVSLAASDRIPNKDFVLRFTGAGAATQIGVLTHRVDREGYFTLLLQPKAEYRESDIAPREVVMVIDRSCSMTGEPLELSKSVANELLSGLTARDTFNFIAFASGTESMSQKPIAADAAGLAQGHRWLDGLTAGGGTEMALGLRTSLARVPGEDRIRMIYLLTDGFVGNDEDIVQVTRETTSINRVFPIGVSSSPNRALLDRLGEVGRGFTTYLTSGAELRPALKSLVMRTTQPYLTDITLDWGKLQVNGVTPAVVPDVYAGLPVVIAGKFPAAGKGMLVINARSAGKPVRYEVPLTLPERDDRPAVAALWARRRIHELEADNVRDARRNEIEKLGLRFSLVTPYTSFVAVDDGPRRAPGPSRSVVQPVETPAGLDFDGTLKGAEVATGSSPAPSPSPMPTSSSADSRPSSGGGGGGGDIDPFTIATIASLMPLAWAMRKRRAQQAAGPRA